MGFGIGVSAVLLMLLFPAPAIADGQATTGRPGVDHLGAVVGAPLLHPIPIPTLRSLAPAKFDVQNSARIVIAPPRSISPSSLGQATSAQSNPMLYQGGNVLSSVKVYVDFWGPEWEASSQAPVMSYIEGFFNDVGGSSWAGIMGQYCSGIATNSSSCPLGSNFIQNPRGQLAGFFINTASAPSVPTQSDIDNQAQSFAASEGYPTGALLMIYTPSGKSQAGFGTSFCAYHSWVSAGSSLFSYGYMPYQPDAGFACGANLVDGPLDGFSIVGGHEYAEAVTDPFPSTSAGFTGWLDPTLGWAGEIGDKCAWNPSPINVTMNGQSWPVQGLFSNRELAQGHPPCPFAFPPAVTTQPVDQTVTAGATATFTSTASGSATPTVQWRVSTNGGATYSDLAGATSTTLMIAGTTVAMSGNQYRAVFTNSSGTATSNAATLTVEGPPAVMTQPTDQTVTAGATVTFTSTASGGPPPTVQWQVSTNGGATFSDLAGATSTTLMLGGTTVVMSGNQ